MKKKQRVLIGLVSAVITFGVLFATVGKPKYLEKHICKLECSKK